MSSFFTADYVERTELRDGTPVVIRLVTPEDRVLLARGFAKLSANSRYARFLVPKVSLSDDELAYLTEIDQQNHFALGAIHEAGDGHGEAIGAGIARFVRLPTEHAIAEAAIAVADDLQGRGLGKLLFLRLCAAASERGIERFRCELLATNTQMLSLLESVSGERTALTDGGVTTIDLVLPDVTPTEPPTSPPPRSTGYNLLRAAAKNAIEWTEAVRRLWRR